MTMSAAETGLLVRLHFSAKFCQAIVKHMVNVGTKV